jgi:nitric oxide reductase subunit B
MIVLSLLPIGLAQAWASVEHGLWYARSADFLQQPVLEALRWMRMVGDTLFIAGVAAFVAFVAGIFTRRPAVAVAAPPAGGGGEPEAVPAALASRAQIG